RASGERGRSLSPENHRGVVAIGGERDGRQPLERLLVPPPGVENDLFRQLRTGVGLVPAGRLAVVADELLVEAVLRPARLVRLAGPEAGGVGGPGLVAPYAVPLGSG